jgi:hypothetical protein
VAAALLLTAFSEPGVLGGIEVCPLAGVRAGQRGVARTVFAGAEPEEFDLEVLGVAQNGLGPGKDLIVIRLMGERVEHTGVVAGMSGSPVMIGGCLAGALAYRLGAFTKEPIAGVTPFAYMAAIPADGGGSPSATYGGQREAVAAIAALADPETRVQRGLLPPPGVETADESHPLRVPLMLAGAVPGLLDQLAGSLERAGWFGVVGGGPVAPIASPSRGLAPGDAVAALLLDGELTVAATGTVTAVDGDRVWAFGHPFLRTGATNLPMTRVDIVTTVASEMNSYKVGNVGAAIGTFNQDQAAGIAGRLGPVPRLLPLQVTLRSDGAPPRIHHFGLVDHPAWSPFLVQLAVLNTALPDLAYGDDVTVVMDATVRLAERQEARFHEAYAGGVAAVPPAVAAAAETGLLVASLSGNRFGPPAIESIDVDLSISPRRGPLTLEAAEPSRRRVRPGEAVEVRASISTYRAAPEPYPLVLRLPEDLQPGSLQVVVGGAGAVDQSERRAATQRLQQLDSVAAIVGWINELRSSDRLYARAYRHGAGAVVDGRLLPALPGSVLDVFAGDRSGGGFAYIDQVPVAETSRTLPGPLVGSRSFTLEVLPAGDAPASGGNDE